MHLMIMAGPDKPPLVKGTGGLRKIRLGRRDGSRGKSGGFRIGYVFFATFSIVLLVTVYGKDEKAELSMADRKAIRRIIELIEDQLRSGRIP